MDKSEAERLLVRLQIAVAKETHAVNTATWRGHRGTKGVSQEITRVVRRLYWVLTGEKPSDETLSRITRW